MTPQEIISVVTAFRDGAEIEVKSPLSKWSPIEIPAWNFSDYQYRIKPKPPAMETVKLLAYMNGNQLIWIKDTPEAVTTYLKRVPSEDKTVGVEV